MTRRNVPYPPYRALPPPSPYWMGRRGMQPLSRSRRLAWEQQMRRWVGRGDLAPALRLSLAHLSRALPPRRQRSEGTLAAVACALYALEGPAPRLLRVEDILMGCFLHWMDTGAKPRWGPLTMQCVP